MEQLRLAAIATVPWGPPEEPYGACGCFLCFPRGQSGYGDKGDAAWAAAARISPEDGMETSLVRGTAAAPYRAGLLALREGSLLESAVRALRCPGRVLLVNATGRDHPRRAGLALHLGAILDIPTVGVTHRPLVARGEWPAASRGASTPLEIGGKRVGLRLRTSSMGRPLAVHPAWRTDAETARSVVLTATQ
ncbi:MAG: endonuclease V, partial [Acidobacteriota bacterium]